MIHSPETAKILVVLLLSLIVVSSTFSGTGISMPVGAKDSEPNPIEREESNGTTTPIVADNDNDISADAVGQTYRSFRSNTIQSELGITETVSDNDNGSSSPSSDSASSEDMQALQTPIIGHFSGSINQEIWFPSFESPDPILLHSVATMEGDLSSNDGLSYFPTGTWHMSVDIEQEFSHIGYTGPASSTCGEGAHYICVILEGQPNPDFGLFYITATGTFANKISAFATEVGRNVIVPNPLIGIGNGNEFPLDWTETERSEVLGHPGLFNTYTHSWTFDPRCIPPSGVSGGAENVGVQQFDPDSPQIAQNDPQCKPPVKVKGNVLLQTPPQDRGDIFIPHLKVELCSISAENNCPVSTFTDEAGNYELSTDELTKDDARLQITFLNRDSDMLATQYPNNDPAKIRIANLPFITEPITGVSLAAVDVKFQNIRPYISINNQPGGLSVTTINVDQDGSMAALAGVFYYAERSMQFTKQTPIALNYNLPLKVKINAPSSTSFFDPTTTSIEYNRVAGFRIGGINQDKVEASLDTLFHEFGHFLMFEIFRGEPPATRTLNLDYLAAVPKGHPDADEDCHNGYAQIDSSCAMTEGKAWFFGALLEDRVLDGLPNHAQYKALSKFITKEVKNSFKVVNIEDPLHVAGDKKFKKSPFFEHRGDAEEFAVASLLWDLYDFTPFEQLGESLGTEQVEMDLRVLIGSLIFAKTTSEYYSSLAKVVDKDLLDAIFANHGVCLDLNGDGECQKTEVIEGRSAWNVKYRKATYGYLLPVGRF